MKKPAKAIPNIQLFMARKERGWTQQKVADGIGAPLALNVTRWERGMAKPSAYYTERLCQLFGKSASELGLIYKKASEEESTSNQTLIEPSEGETQRYWHIPYWHNPFFTGREGLLKTLSQMLHSTGNVALSGLGGIGKTQLALEYAYRSREQYQATFWIRTANQEMLKADFTHLARLLGLPEHDSQKPQEVIDAIKRWLASHQGWLLILDNVDSLEIIRDLLPQTDAGHILLTTRTQSTGIFAGTIEVEPMEERESSLFLLRRSKYLAPALLLEHANEDVRNQAQRIAQELGGLPLALEQAAAYIEEMGCGLDEYLALYQNNKADLLRRRSDLSHEYPHNVMNTWSLSFQKVEEVSSAGAELLKLCAFLAPDAIQEALLKEGAGQLGPQLSSIITNPLLFNEAIRVLRSFSLIRRHPQTKTLSLHRLVQTALREHMEEREQHQWARQAVQLVHAALPETEYEDWIRYQELLPHAQLCTELIILYRFCFPEAVQLLVKTGAYLRQRVNYKEAEICLREALKLCEQMYGLEHTETANALHQLALLYCGWGQYAQAEPLYLRAVAMLERLAGPEHPKTINCLNDLALLYWERGEYEHAEALLQRVKQLQENLPVKNDMQLATTLGNLGLLYLQQGKYNQAEAFYQQTLSMRERILGAHHPKVADILSDLGVLYYHREQHYDHMGGYAQAEIFYQRALAIYEQANDFASTLVLHNLATLYRAQGQIERAEQIHLQVLNLRKETLGQKHPSVALSLNNLGDVYYDRGQMEQAEKLYQQALEIGEQAFASDTPSVARSLARLARFYYTQGQLEQAKTYYQRALAGWAHGHPEKTKLQEEYASLLHESE